MIEHGPSPQPYEDAVPSGVAVVHYASGGRRLLAWLADPSPESDAPKPLLVFAHGGFALGEGDFLDTRLFLEAGMMVLMPALRGENGNPGHFELAYGEVEDLVAAVRFAAGLPRVDRRRIYLIGHSAGGMASSMAALEPDLPVALTASVGGVYSPDAVAGMDFAPFDRSDARELRLRSMLPFAAQLAHRHIAYVGRDDEWIRSNFRPVRGAVARSGGRLVVLDVPGDHFTSLPLAMADFLARIRALEAGSGS